jgi:hypothetical protein
VCLYPKGNNTQAMSRPRTQLLVILASVIVIGLVAIFAITISMSLPSIPISDSGIGNYSCQPVDINRVNADFPIRQPAAQSMPSGYALRIAQDQQGRIVLYYDDNSLTCPLPLDKITQAIENGTIAVAIYKASSSGYADPQSFQEGELQYFKSKEANAADVQAIDVGEYKGVGASHAPSQQTSVLFFYHETDQTIYGIYGDLTVGELTDIARTIPHS